MKRRSFLKGLLGLLSAPVAAKVLKVVDVPLEGPAAPVVVGVDSGGLDRTVVTLRQGNLIVDGQCPPHWPGLDPTIEGRDPKELWPGLEKAWREAYRNHFSEPVK